MKFLLLPLITCFVFSSTAVAQNAKRIPSFSQLASVAGVHTDSNDFKRLLQGYPFTPSPKRDHSWGSGFGVFLEQSKTGLVSVGIRPPSSSTNMPTYRGTLPWGLKAEDTIETLKMKLGKPDRIDEPSPGYLIMHYKGYNVIASGGKLFEIWLTDMKEKSEPVTAP